MSQIADSIQIRNTTFKNRIIKGAMSEALANHEGQPNELHIGLYEAWAKGGLGCAITGNVMVNIAAKNEPGVVAIETERDLAKLQQWAAVGKKYGMVQLIQLSHPGRQCPKGLNKETVAPSAVNLYGLERIRLIYAAFTIPSILEVTRASVEACVAENDASHVISCEAARLIAPEQRWISDFDEFNGCIVPAAEELEPSNSIRGFTVVAS